jgi:hypothetical protein
MRYLEVASDQSLHNSFSAHCEIHNTMFSAYVFITGSCITAFNAYCRHIWLELVFRKNIVYLMENRYLDPIGVNSYQHTSNSKLSRHSKVCAVFLASLLANSKTEMSFTEGFIVSSRPVRTILNLSSPAHLQQLKPYHGFKQQLWKKE